jgi:thiosulfate dehydrogenase [quinone] large subunit
MKAPRTSIFPTGLGLVQLALAYEWLISGINKLANPNFTVQLAGTIRQSLDGNPYSWYVAFLKAVVLPHATAIGVLTELGETAIGITLAVSAMLWLRRPYSPSTRIAGIAACAALAGAAFLSLNYFLQGGSTLPWINPGNAFNEGVDIDILIPLVSLGLLFANFRAARAAASAAVRTPATLQRSIPWAS